MLTLFKIDSKRKVVLDKATLKLAPELDKISQAQLMYIVLAYDYQSKFKQFPETERTKRASYEVFKGKPVAEIEKGVIMATAIETYKGLQYDSLREILRTYKNKIDRMNELLLVEDNAKTTKDLMDTIDRLYKAMKGVQKEISMDEDRETMKGDGELSRIEKLHTMKENLNTYLERRVNIRKKEEEYSKDVAD